MNLNTFFYDPAIGLEPSLIDFIFSPFLSLIYLVCCVGLMAVFFQKGDDLDPEPIILFTLSTIAVFLLAFRIGFWVLGGGG